MQSSLSSCQDPTHSLTAALLVYGDSIAILHKPVVVKNKLTLGVGAPITEAALRGLLHTIQPTPEISIIPECLLYRGSTTMVWYTPASTARMWFTDLPTLNGSIFHQPACAWAVRGNSLYVKALPTSGRPTLESQLLVAPYWNVSGDGLVCLGSMAHPNTTTTETLNTWVHGFFGSSFTHPNSSFHWKKGIGFTEMWNHAKEHSFPIKWLAPTKQTLGAWLHEITE